MKKRINKNTKAYQKKQAKRNDKAMLKGWSIAVKADDYNSCAVCSSTKHLNAHHILPRERRNTRYDPQNGVALCALHHQFSRELSAHHNSFAFFVWFMRNRPEQFKYLKGLVENGGL